MTWQTAAAWLCRSVRSRGLWSDDNEESTDAPPQASPGTPDEGGRWSFVMGVAKIIDDVGHQNRNSDHCGHSMYYIHHHSQTCHHPIQHQHHPTLCFQTPNSK